MLLYRFIVLPVPARSAGDCPLFTVAGRVIPVPVCAYCKSAAWAIICSKVISPRAHCSMYG